MDLPAQFQAFQDKEGRIVRLPAKHSKKQDLCLFLLGAFEEGVSYSEPEVTRILLQYVDDFAYVRRVLVNMGLLERDRYGRVYRRVSAAA